VLPPGLSQPSETHSTYIAEIASGLSDTEALALARAEQRLFLTEDKDFGELVFRFQLPVPGLVLLRIETTKPPEHRWTRLEAVIAQIGEGLFGRYVVVTENRTRSRPLVIT
jgi:predicted nuclease of predicted toxin-antitoxin system